MYDPFLFLYPESGLGGCINYLLLQNKQHEILGVLNNNHYYYVVSNLGWLGWVVWGPFVLPVVTHATQVIRQLERVWRVGDGLCLADCQILDSILCGCSSGLAWSHSHGSFRVSATARREYKHFSVLCLYKYPTC